MSYDWEIYVGRNFIQHLLKAIEDNPNLFENDYMADDEFLCNEQPLVVFDKEKAKKIL